MTLSIGIHHGVSEKIYHADPCAYPSLSSGIGRRIVQRSLKHAWHAHPRLNPDYQNEPGTPAQQLGTALHSMILGAGAQPVEVPFDDYRSAAAKASRDAVLAAGNIPMKPEEFANAKRVVDAAREQFEQFEEIPFRDGKPEAVAIWEDGAALCRALIDWLPDDQRAPVWDLKTTSQSAAPEDWERSLIKDYAFQAAFCRQGLLKLRGYAPDFRFVVVEVNEPYCVCVYQPDPSLLAVAEYQVSEALDRWERALMTGEWPGYDRRTHHVEAPAWLLAKLEVAEAIKRVSPADVARAQKLSAGIGAPLK